MPDLLSGAASGASFGPWGMVAGGALGALGGLLGGNGGYSIHRPGDVSGPGGNVTYTGNKNHPDVNTLLLKTLTFPYNSLV